LRSILPASAIPSFSGLSWGLFGPQGILQGPDVFRVISSIPGRRDPFPEMPDPAFADPPKVFLALKVLFPH
jgi:hypothetical protein